MDKIAQIVDIWKKKGLSIRASHVLAKADISEVQLAKYQKVDELIQIKNCGSQTAQEILDFITSDIDVGSQLEVKEVKFEDLIPK